MSLLSKLVRKAAKSKLVRRAAGAAFTAALPGGFAGKIMASKLKSIGAKVIRNKVAARQNKSVEAAAARVASQLDQMPRPTVTNVKGPSSGDWTASDSPARRSSSRSRTPRGRVKAAKKARGAKISAADWRRYDEAVGIDEDDPNIDAKARAWLKANPKGKAKVKAKPLSKRAKRAARREKAAASGRPKRKAPSGGLDFRAMRAAHKAAGEPVPWKEWTRDKANHIRTKG